MIMSTSAEQLGVSRLGDRDRPLTNYVIEGDAKTKALDVYHLIFAPTFACNLRCRQCYLPNHGTHLFPREMAHQLLDDWAKIVSAERGPFGGIFHLKGGEPFVVSYFGALLERIARQQLTLMITTNGTVHSKKSLEAIAACNQSLGQHVVINVSLDGATEETHGLLRGPGTFQKTLAFIRRLVAIDLTVHVNSVIHKRNVHEITQLISLALSENVAQLNLLPFVPKGYGSDLWDWGVDPLDLCEAIDRLYSSGTDAVRRVLSGCYAHILERELHGTATSNECVGGYRGLFYVVPNGDVFSCPNLVDSHLLIGNLHKNTLEELHRETHARVYSRSIGCGGCSNRYVCKGEALLHGPDLLAHERRARLVRLQQRLLSISVDERVQNLSEGRSYCFSRNL